MTGQLTGNGRALETRGKGRVEKASVAESVTAETLDLDYVVRIPDFDFAGAAIEANVGGKQIVVSGQQVATLDGKVGYAKRSVSFDVRAADRARTVDAAGRVDLLEGHQHVVLSKLAATVDTLTWRLREGAEATVDYDGEELTIAGLALTHDAATVDANGTVAVGPKAESRLELSIAGLQVADINRLLQRPPGEYAGLLTGLVTVAGTRAQPEVLARFRLTEGAVRELKFAEVGGDVTYDGRFFGVDVTLVQQPGTTLAARGQFPLGDDSGGERGARARSHRPARHQLDDRPADRERSDEGAHQRWPARRRSICTCAARRTRRSFRAASRSATAPSLWCAPADTTRA